MGAFGLRLVTATPGGPVQDLGRHRWWLPDEGEEQAAHFRDGQRQQVQQLDSHEVQVLARRFLLARPPFRLS